MLDSTVEGLYRDASRVSASAGMFKEVNVNNKTIPLRASRDTLDDTCGLGLVCGRPPPIAPRADSWLVVVAAGSEA